MCAARRATAMSLRQRVIATTTTKNENRRQPRNKSKQRRWRAAISATQSSVSVSVSVNVCLIHESSHVNRQKHIKTKEQITCAQLRLLQSSSKRGLSSSADKPESTRQSEQTAPPAEAGFATFRWRADHCHSPQRSSPARAPA